MGSEGRMKLIRGAFWFVIFVGAEIAGWLAEQFPAREPKRKGVAPWAR